VVEDNLDDALLMIRAFARADIHTPLPILKSGDEAIAYLAEASSSDSRLRLHGPSLVLLDLELPGKSGFEVLAWIRRQPMLRRLPVVILSTSSDLDRVYRAYELGANSYLVKPATLKDLVELVSGVQRFWGTHNHGWPEDWTGGSPCP